MSVRKSKAAKELSGTTRKSRELRGRPLDNSLVPQVPESEKYESLPSPPKWMKQAYAKELWERLGIGLVRSRLLSDLNIESFAVLCSVGAVVNYGWTVPSGPTGHYLALFRSYCSDFGIQGTRVIQQVEASAKEKQVNPFLKHEASSEVRVPASGRKSGVAEELRFNS